MFNLKLGHQVLLAAVLSPLRIFMNSSTVKLLGINDLPEVETLWNEVAMT